MYKLTQNKDMIYKVPTPEEPGARFMVKGSEMECGITFQVQRYHDGSIAPVTPELRAYKEWLDAGNEPLPADPIPEPAEETVEDKLRRSGLTLDELRSALGL